ncbi:substrate-binding periplasmic protein [Thalassotalea ganghwensis]
MISIKQVVIVMLIAISSYAKPLYSQEMEKIVPESKLSKTIVTGLPKPPYVMEGQTGIQLELMKEALKELNIELNFIHIPFGRGTTGYHQYNADGVLTLPPEFDYPSMYMSKPYVTYQNVAVSLLEKNYTIDSIADLTGKSVTAFQNARRYLGEEFGAMIGAFMDYRELPDQNKQMELLFLRRTEVIVLDVNIFKYYLQSHPDRELAKPFKLHYIFGERPYSVGFRSKEIRDVFDKNIQKMRENGTYQLIMEKYQ